MTWQTRLIPMWTPGVNGCFHSGLVLPGEIIVSPVPVGVSFPRFYSAAAAAAKSLQLCPTLCDPIDGSPPGSPVPGILQARTLEWVAISFSVLISQARVQYEKLKSQK